MIINHASLQALYVAFKMAYDAGARSAAPLHDKIADVYSIQAKEVDFPIPEGVPMFRDWPDGEPRLWKNLAAHNTKITNADKELSVEVPRDAIRYDQIGLYNNSFAAMGKQSVMVWDDLAFATLLAGSTALCFDGQFFFDTDHPIKPSDAASAVQSNKHTGRAFSEANLDLAFGDFLAWKDPNGRELGIPPNELWVGTPNWSAAQRIATAEFNAAGATNIYKGAFVVRLIPGLGTSWILASTDQGVKPIAINKAFLPVMLTLAAPTDENVLEQRKFRYAGDCSGAACLTLPGLAHLNTP